MKYSLKNSLRNLQIQSYLSDSDMAQIMNISVSSYQNIRDKNYSPPFSSVANIADAFGLNIESLIGNGFCTETAVNFFTGNKFKIPEKYSVYKSSNVKTVANFLDFISWKMGKVKAESIAKKYQITQEVLAKNDMKISGEVLLDIYSELSHIDFNQYEEMGLLASQKYSKDFLGKIVYLENTPKIAYQNIIASLSKTVDKNLSYKIIKIDNKRLYLSVKTREETSSMLSIKHFGCVQHCYNIIGWYKGFLRYIDTNNAIVKKLSCVHFGDQECLYEVDYSHYKGKQALTPNQYDIFQ